MHTVVMQVQNGTQLRALLDYLQTVGFGRVIFPGRECVGEDTCRLVPIVQEDPVGQYSGQAAPFDESPTVAILDRWRTTIKQHNGQVWMSRMAIRQDDTACNVRHIGDEGPTATAPSARFVQSVIFGDAPAPAGMDSEMIAAARRIARRLWPN
jgi:hypothetical protein